MIRFQCDGCGHGIGVADMHAGRKDRCPKCQQIVRVPAPIWEEHAWDGVITKADMCRVLAYAIAAHAETRQEDDERSDTRQCPHCRGTILSGTIKCMRCGMRLYEERHSDPTRRVRERASGSDLGVSMPSGMETTLAACETDWPQVRRTGWDIADLVEPLLQASGWIRGVALASIVIGGLWCLFGFALLVGSPPKPLATHGNAIVGFVMGYIGTRSVSIYLGIILYQVASFIRRSHETMDRNLLRDGLKKLSMIPRQGP